MHSILKFPVCTVARAQVLLCLLTGKPIQLYSYNMHVYEAIKSNKYSYIVSAPAIAMVS